MEWKDCIRLAYAKETAKDEDLARALLLSSENIRLTLEMMPLNGITAASKALLAYESLREILEAIAASRGYRIYNHECLGRFTSEILKSKDIASRFSRIRVLRNNISYEGRSVSMDEVRYLLAEIAELASVLVKMARKTMAR